MRTTHWANNFVAIARNAKSFELHIIFNWRSYEMETGTDHERVKDNVHDDGELGLSGLRVLPPMSSA